MFRSAGLAITATLIGQLLNFAVDVLIAGTFGTSWRADAYYLALIIPIMIIDLFALAINAVFIPSYVERQRSGGGDEFFSSMLNASSILAVFVCAAAYFLLPSLVDAVAGGFTPQARSLTVMLTRMLIVLIFTAQVSSFLSSRLNAHGRFFLPALGKSFNYVFIIIALFALKDAFGILSLPMGYVAGSVVFILSLFMLFRREGLGYSFRLCPKAAVLKETGVMLIPLFASAIASYGGILVERAIAAGFPEGSIAALSYAFKLVNVPINLFILGAMSVVLPAFSTLARDADTNGLAELFTRGLRVVSFFIIPASAGIALLRAPLISLLFERGAFTPSSSLMTSTALLYYVFGIFGAASVSVASRVFLALKDIKTMSILGIFIVALNIVLLVVLSSALGFTGIPLAFSITSSVHIALMLVILERRTGMDIIRPILAPVAKHLVAAAAMTAVLLLLASPLRLYLPLTVKAAQFAYIAVFAAAGTALYLAFCRALRVEETGFILERLNAAFLKQSQIK
ncbi:MAG: murein biosynthesis integral membrane protein MurJ [Deltaproteobacteria bacterium]|nr:murein biosynthesis integral membrane protein MurJ [Deltaproteobacteria bacterium]